MKRLLLLFCIFLFSSFIAISKPYSDYYPNGQIHYKFKKRNNTLHGDYIYWHSNGNKAVEGKFKKGKREGLWQAWYENGNRCYQRNFKNGEESGITTYYYENGQKQASGTYKDNLREGEWEIWYPNGMLKAKGNCRLGLFEGKWIFHTEIADTINYIFSNYQNEKRFIGNYSKYKKNLKYRALSLIQIKQKVNNKTRFILNINSERAYILEKDFDLTFAYHGFLDFTYQGICWDAESWDGFDESRFYRTLISLQYSEFIHGILNGFNQQIHKSYRLDSKGTFLTYYNQNNYFKDGKFNGKLFLDNKESVNGTWRTNELINESLRNAHLLPVQKYYIDSITPVSQLCMEVDFRDSKFRFTPLYFQSTDTCYTIKPLLLTEDTVNNIWKDYGEILVSDFIKNHYPNIRDARAYLNNPNLFSLIITTQESMKSDTIQFIKDPLYSEFAYLPNFHLYNGIFERHYVFGETWSLFPSAIPKINGKFRNYDLEKYHIPFNASVFPYNYFLHGKVIIWKDNEKYETYYFDYGFLKSYTKHK